MRTWVDSSNSYGEARRLAEIGSGHLRESDRPRKFLGFRSSAVSMRISP